MIKTLEKPAKSIKKLNLEGIMGKKVKSSGKVKQGLKKHQMTSII